MTQTQIEESMTIGEFDQATSSLLKETTEMLSVNEESIQDILNELSMKIQDEEKKIEALDENIDKFQHLMDKLTQQFQELFIKI